MRPKPEGAASYGPSWAEYKQNFLGPLLAGGIAGLLVVGVTGWLRFGAWAPVLLVALVALTVGYLTMYFHLLRVTVDGTTLRYRSSFGVRRSWPLDVATTAVITTDLQSSGGRSANSGRNLFVFDGGGRRLFRLSSGAWSLDDLHAIATSLPRAHVDELDRWISEEELNRLHPHATPWAEQHVIVFSLIVGVGGTAVLVTAIAIAIALIVVAVGG